MPISIEAVSKEDFEAWVQQAQEEFARADTVNVASSSVPRN
jgi:heme/copper-type cytochrome/quinol oxidase subunit 2